MCEASKLADDWVVKGCHIHVYGVELVIYTNHLGEIRARPFFSSARQDLAKKAIKAVYEECLHSGSRQGSKYNSYCAYTFGSSFSLYKDRYEPGSIGDGRRDKEY